MLPRIGAYQFPQNGKWLNIKEPLSIEKLKGQVVLLDFWTYCCINCIQVLDEIKELERLFARESFVVIGVHSPKFKNEQNYENIQSAIARYNINHPIIADNQRDLWQKYTIRSWPSFIIIDAEGNVAGRISGEGVFRTLHKTIIRLLDEGKRKKTLKPKLELKTTIIKNQTTLSYPGKIYYDQDQNLLYISNSGKNQIIQAKKVKNNQFKIINVIGSGKSGDQDGSFTQAEFKDPQGLTQFKDKLYVCDRANHKIKAVDLIQNNVKTVAGTGLRGDFKAQTFQASKYDLASPWDIWAKNEQLFITNAGTHQILVLNISKNTLEIFAGSGWENLLDGKRENAQFAQPSGLVTDEQNLYIADSESSSIRAINFRTGLVKTIIGEGLFDYGDLDGNLSTSRLQHPLGIAKSGNNIYIADTYNHALRVIDQKNKLIQTLIKRSSSKTCQINDQTCSVLPLNEPSGLALGNKDELYIADTNNHLIRVFNLKTQTLSDLNIVSKE